ncbi:alpha/beta hydrolase [Goodfellowiella coeruleoviolacea]|uniref:Alpha/beta hydrolase family protein n=1 Tax=Goodfellowiella coeruleoviolacea TaxID=334858 RepID=A0AAE3KJ24_9PSEU|nr:alpha/beta fold hydrolase [Goodfellowiella coeruleoviolacea]MCP2168592.1 Alpha/beta hydrolase family protein [Goodfellowiella coeruleoviolacea]
MTQLPPAETLFVLVHGAWHSSVHWAATQRALAGHGLASIAVDLPGHGIDAPVPSGYLLAGQPGLATEKSAVADVTMRDNADAVLAVLADVRPRFRHVVLVAHSAGGGPASAATERAPDLVDHLVYLSAFVPAGRPRFADYIGAEENADAVIIPPVGDPAELGAFRINPLSDDPDLVATIRRAFLNDLPAAAPDGWRHLLHPDLPTAVFAEPVPVTAERWGRVRRTYVRLTDDLALPLGTQDLMIREADRTTPEHPFQVRSLPGGHSPFVTRPDDLAALLASLAPGVNTAHGDPR